MLTLVIHPHILPEGEDPGYYSPDPRQIYQEAASKMLFAPISYGDKAPYVASSSEFTKFVTRIDELHKEKNFAPYSSAIPKSVKVQERDPWSDRTQFKDSYFYQPVLNLFDYKEEIMKALLVLSYFEHDILQTYKEVIESGKLLEKLANANPTIQKGYHEDTPEIRLLRDFYEYSGVRTNSISRATFSTNEYGKPYLSCPSIYAWLMDRFRLEGRDRTDEEKIELIVWQTDMDKIASVILYAVFIDIEMPYYHPLADAIGNLKYRF